MHVFIIFCNSFRLFTHTCMSVWGITTILISAQTSHLAILCKLWCKSFRWFSNYVVNYKTLVLQSSRNTSMFNISKWIKSLFFSLHDFEFLLEIKLKHFLLLRKAAKFSVRVFSIKTRGTCGIASLYCIMLGHKPWKWEVILVHLLHGNHFYQKINWYQNVKNVCPTVIFRSFNTSSSS